MVVKPVKVGLTGINSYLISSFNKRGGNIRVNGLRVIISRAGRDISLGVQRQELGRFYRRAPTPFFFKIPVLPGVCPADLLQG